MNALKRNTVFFCAGGIGYGLLELLWRGRTHWSMLLAGGLCFTLFSHMVRRFRHRSRLCKAALFAVTVTGVELVFGVIFNRILKMKVWDYSRMPFNFLGQICLYYSLLWGIVGALLLPLTERLNRALEPTH